MGKFDELKIVYHGDLLTAVDCDGRRVTPSFFHREKLVEYIHDFLPSFNIVEEFSK